MEVSSQLIQPLVALVIWSMVMWLWMYATRLPAIISMRLEMDPMAPSGEQMAKLPARVRWKADNYNHLMEQPTLFYALVLALSIMGVSSELAIYAAWAFVVLRIIHSLVHVLGNKIELRFAIFVASNIPLLFLVFIAARSAFNW
ncbi:MAPEG family protein [Microbulbifer agarilyticus]|uniref:MAPEG family protein n=1 Tax=Microbulbifer agarilyticus TaxID=260552 RepID=UPI001CD79777|nr:MAPEG family protein [Microbulbifer agarilyticus]MCA0894825.1 MAPEG family protein [Microbulbifer agarilyticus]